MVQLGEGSEAGRGPRPSHEIDLSHLSRTPADTPPWTPAYSLPPPVAHVPSNQVGAAPRGSSRVYANPRAPPLAKRPAKLSPRKAPRHLIDWGPSPHTSDAERETVHMPEKPPPLEKMDGSSRQKLGMPLPPPDRSHGSHSGHGSHSVKQEHKWQQLRIVPHSDERRPRTTEANIGKNQESLGTTKANLGNSKEKLQQN